MQPTKTSALQDGALISASFTDPACFAELFDRHYTTIFRYLQRRVELDDAYDLASDVFTRAFDGRSRFNTQQENALPWLYGIATNLLRQHYRTQQRRFSAYQRVGNSIVAGSDEAESVADRCSAQALWQQLTPALSRLGESERETLFLHVWGELSLKEVAFALGVSQVSVRARLSRALRKLRREVGGREGFSEKELKATILQNKGGQL